MSATPDVVSPQKITEIAQCWKGVHLVGPDGVKPGKVQSADASSSSDELNTKVRKPYTITKQRERWTESEHQKFLDALKLYGRAWRRIEEHIGTKTAVQIRSHAQKFFSKLEREASTGNSGGKLPDIAIPPPRPKRKPSHPYPRKGGSSLCLLEGEREEAMLLSPACRNAAHSEGFQMGFLSPCRSQGLSAGCVVESSATNGQVFDWQGNVKLFGKTVSIPKGDKGALGGFASCDALVRHDDAVPANQSSAEPSEIVGFSSSAEIRNKIDSFPQTAIQSDGNVCQAEANQPEDTGESFGGACGYDRPGTDIEAGDSVNCTNRDCQVSDDWEQGNFETGLSADLKEADRGCVRLSHVTNPAIFNWTNNVSQWQNGNLVPPISTSGSIDIPSGSPWSYWQFIQASAMNYAAYTAAMAAVAVAGLKPPNSGGADSTILKEGQLPALLSPPWWPYGRFIPPVFLHPPNKVEQGDVLPTSKAAMEVRDVKGVGVLVECSLQGEEPDACLKAAEIADTCNTPLVAGYETNLDHSIINSSIQMCSTLETSCLTQASVKIVPDSDLRIYAAAMRMPVKASDQTSDTEIRDAFMSPQNSCSTSDEFEDPLKKQREGSSSGSNTPASKYRSGESGAPKIAESKNNSHTAPEDNDDGWSDNFLISQQQCVADTAELLNQRVKQAEKGRKHQHRDARHGGGGGDSKRFKSCTHEMEVRKEVSQEGRKAFQALFASKLLPQTFPTTEERELMAKDECVSRPTVSRDEAKVTGYGRIRLNAASGEKLSKEIDCPNDSGNLKLCNDSQRFDVQERLATSKGFTVSSSSGFVPYRKLCLDPLNVAQR